MDILVHVNFACDPGTRGLRACATLRGQLRLPIGSWPPFPRFSPKRGCGRGGAMLLL